MRKGTIYIAGPMTGIPYYNFPAFDGAKSLWTYRGWNVISPADLDREGGCDPVDAVTGTETLENFDLVGAYKSDMRAIEECDAVAMLDGWKQSKGAVWEYLLARAMGKIVMDNNTGEVIPDLAIAFMIMGYE